MGEQITNAEWEKISPDNFETASLLRAVDAIDDLRGDFNDGEYSAPPQIRTDLLRLHEIAMAVINEGSRSRVSALFELASDLDEQISHLVNRLDEVQDTLSQLMELYPGVVCGRGRNPTLRLWPAIFSGEIDVFPSERRNMGQEIGR